MAQESEGGGASRGRWVWIAAALAAVALLGSGGLWLVNRDNADPTAGPPAVSAGPTSSSATSPSPESSTPTAPEGGSPTASRSGSASAPEPAPTRTGPPVAPDESALPPVPIEKPADFGDGVSAQIVGVRAVAGNGQGVGDLDAPAVRVRVKVANDTGEPLSLDSVVVNAYYGEDDTPASPLLGDPSADWLRGQLADGRTATGVYLFTIPPSQRDQVVITVSYLAGKPIAVFEGSVPKA